jgi:hypothetical protein
MKKVIILVLLLAMCTFINSQVRFLIEKITASENHIYIVTLSIINDSDSSIVIKTIKSSIPDTLSKIDEFDNFYFVMLDEYGFPPEKKAYFSQCFVKPKNKGKKIKIKSREQKKVSFSFDISNFRLRKISYSFYIVYEIDNYIIRSNTINYRFNP